MHEAPTICSAVLPLKRRDRQTYYISFNSTLCIVLLIKSYYIDYAPAVFETSLEATRILLDTKLGYQTQFKTNCHHSNPIPYACSLMSSNTSPTCTAFSLNTNQFCTFYILHTAESQITCQAFFFFALLITKPWKCRKYLIPSWWSAEETSQPTQTFWVLTTL